jgi:LysW-gamma-L-lysine carboxypeptidase
MAVTDEATADRAALAVIAPNRPLYVVKLGSASLRHERVFDELADLRRRQARILVVAGGAVDIAEHYAAIGRPVRTMPVGADLAVRYCPPEEIAHIIDAYERLTLPRLRDSLSRRGMTVFASTAMAGSLVRAVPNRPVRTYLGGLTRIVRDHRAGTVSAVDTARLEELLAAFDVVCLCPPVAADDGGSALNADADVLAAEAAVRLGADHVRLVTGTPGLLSDPGLPDSTLRHTDPGKAMTYARGRMRQKVRAAGIAVRGTGDIAITGPHTMRASSGTRVWRAPAPGADLNLLSRMVGIASVSGDERELAEYLADWCRERGVAAEIDAAGNLSATRGSGPSRLLMLGHMDTVPHRWLARWDGETLTGRGCVDAKASLAVFLETLAGLDVPEHATVRVVGTVEEERTAAGAFFARDHYPADAVIIGEPSGTGAVTLGYHGVCKVMYSATQSAGHTAAAGARSASSRVLDAVTAAEASIAALSPAALFAVLSMGSGNTGGTRTATAVIDVRVPPLTGLAAVVAALESAAAGTVTATVLLATPPVSTPRASPLVRAFSRTIRGTLGVPPRLLAKTGSSDMNTLATTWHGVPMVAYGPGDAALDHTPHERLTATDYRLARDVLNGAVRDWLASARAGAQAGRELSLAAVPAGGH